MRKDPINPQRIPLNKLLEYPKSNIILNKI